MSGIDDFIRKILEDAGIEIKASFESKVYTDEPIITTASRMKSYMPDKYSEMKRLSADQSSYLSIPRIFLKQARFMEDFEDNCDTPTPFSAYFPTYRVMNDSQLRTYFTWRSGVRHGDIRKTSLSYAFVYVYELLACVGAKDAKDALEKLKQFSEIYGEIDPEIVPYITKWSKDFAVYYSLDPTVLSETDEVKCDRAIASLSDESDDVLFDAICTLSSYNITRSKLFKDHPELTAKVMCRTWRYFGKHCEKKNLRDPVVRFFGVLAWHPIEIFDGAVFYDEKKREDTVYSVSDTYKFRKLNGRWYRLSHFPCGKKNKPLGDMMKYTDSLLREKLGMAPIKAEGTKILSKIVDLSYTEYKEEVEEAERRNIKVDFSSLEEIRKSAQITRESLLTDDERDFSADSPIKESVAGGTEKSPWDSVVMSEFNKSDFETDDKGSEDEILSENEKAILRSIIEETNPDKTAKEHGLILSVAIESINEKLFDTVSDNVIYYDGETPKIEEDYMETVKGAIRR